jgi:putative spermidine/putrescine transport system substrate-binding protein
MSATHNKLSILAGLCAVFGFCFGSFPADAQDKGKIVYVGIGGPTQEALRKALFEPFQKETGIQVVEDTGLAAERVQAEVQSGHPTIDFLTIGSSAYASLLAKELLAPIDYKYYDPADLKTMPEAVRLKFAVGSSFSSLGMSFSTAAFPDGKPQPGSWADFWDVKKFPGKRTLPYCGVLEGSWPIAEAALLADGVPVDKLYPMDMARAVKKLKELSPDVVWWKNTSQPGQYLVSGEAVMALNSVGRTNNLIDGGAPLKYVWNGATIFGDKWIVLKGAPNYDNVMRFLAFAARPKNQAVLAKLIGYAPTNPAAYDVLDKATATRLVTYPDNFKQAFATDYDWWAANVSKWTEVCLSGLSG